MEIEVTVQQMADEVAAAGWMAEKYRAWIIATGTRMLGLDEPLTFKMACRVLVRNGITLQELARRAS